MERHENIHSPDLQQAKADWREEVSLSQKH